MLSPHINPNRFEMTQPNSTLTAAQILDTLRKRGREILLGRMDAMFSHADDTLFGMAERASEARQQNLYFDTMRTLRLERQSLTERFLALVGETERPAGPTPESKNDPEDMFSLSLLDHDQVEENVAVTNMVTKIKNLYATEIAHLETRLEWLAERHSLELPASLYSPQRICEAFRDAMDELEHEIQIKLLIFKLFEQHVASRLADFYRELNETLIESGVLPKIRLQRGGSGRGGGGGGSMG
ncbi:MAG: DUF1631 family protein, partial [Pseudomonadota bacterium]